jgi:DNA-binding MarR family transcriptional regulator
MTAQASDDPAFKVLNEIGIIAQLATNLFERVMPDGMTLAQFTILNHFVRLGGPRRPSDLARAFQVTRATMTSTIGKLEAKALVTVMADETDGRGRQIAITEAGRAMRERCIRALDPRLAALKGEIGSDPFDAALPHLTRIRAALDDLRPG